MNLSTRMPNILYRILTVLVTIASFGLFELVGASEINLGIYAGWFGFIGAIMVLSSIRISLGSFKRVIIEPAEDNSIENDVHQIHVTNYPELLQQVVNEEESESPVILPEIQFGPTSDAPEPDSRQVIPPISANVPLPTIPRAATAKSSQEKPEIDPIEAVVTKEIDKVSNKQEKLEGLKHTIDPRVYVMLKRQYALEKITLKETLAPEEDIFPNQERFLSGQSVLEPNYEPKNPAPETNPPSSLEKQGNDAEMEQFDSIERLQRFKVINAKLQATSRRLKSENENKLHADVNLQPESKKKKVTGIISLEEATLSA